MSTPKSAIIIGGGIAGLATAALLTKRGVQVKLFESRTELGGRMGTWVQDGFRFDTGPSWYLMPEVFEHYFELIGTTTKQAVDLVKLDPAYRIFDEAGDYPRGLDVVSGRAEAIELFESVEPGAGARLGRYLDSAGSAYDLAVSKFLYDSYENTAGLRDPALLREAPRLGKLLVESLGGAAERQFDSPVLRQILGYPAVFLGGSPYDLPSLYHLMSHLDLTDGVYYPQGGFFRIIEFIAAQAVDFGAEVQTGTPVQRILTKDARAIGVELASGEQHFADVVVSGADLHFTETQLLPPELRSYPQRWWRNKTPSPGTVLLLLGVQGELPQLAHHSLLFSTDWRRNFDDIFGRMPKVPDPASIYVSRTSATDPGAAPAGHENLVILVPVPSDPTIGRGGVAGGGSPQVEAIADQAIDQLATWAHIPGLADRIVLRRTIGPGDFEADFHSWRGNGLGLAHILRQSAFFRPTNASRKVKDLYYVGGTTLPGIGMPMCLISAELVTKRLFGLSKPGRMVA